jgi:hypothetical protein
LEAQVTSLRHHKSAFTQPFSFCLLSFSLFILGCGAGSPAKIPMAGPKLQGNVQAVQQPVAGSTIRLYAAGTSGYGAGALSLLTAPVSTDASGAFSITGQYTCPTASSQLYIVATGGNPGLGTPTNNASLALMAALGPCSLHGNQYTLDPNSFININEVTTVASVYALAGFIDPATSQIGASASNSIGIANAFKTVSNLVNIATGQSLATTPAGNGTVPQTEINTLADIIAPCVNSSGSGSECAALFAAATPSGGTAPTNTLQAVFNIATHPAQQVGGLYGLFSPTSPFQPTLPSAPNDWTVTVNYRGSELAQPLGVSIDSLGNVWIANDPGSVVKWSSNGANLSGPTGFTGGGINGPRGMAIDIFDNAWVASFLGNSVTEFSNSGSILSGPNGFTNGISGVNGPTYVAIDGTGDAWITNQTLPGFTVTKLANDGSLIAASISPCPSASTCQLAFPAQIAIDASENVWIANSNPGPGAVSKLDHNGTALSSQNGFTNGVANPGFIAFDHSGNAWLTNYASDGVNNNVTKLNSSGNLLSSVNVSGLLQPYGIAIDGSGNAWANSFSNASVVELTNNLTVLSGANGYLDAAPVPPYPGCTPPSAPQCIPPRNSRAIAVDGSGNVWVTNGDASISEFIGAATPVVTPLSVGVKNNALGTRP